MAQASTVWVRRVFLRSAGSKASANERVSGAFTWTFVREWERDPTSHLLLTDSPTRTLLPVNERGGGSLSPLHGECSAKVERVHQRGESSHGERWGWEF